MKIGSINLYGDRKSLQIANTIINDNNISDKTFVVSVGEHNSFQEVEYVSDSLEKAIDVFDNLSKENGLQSFNLEVNPIPKHKENVYTKSNGVDFVKIQMFIKNKL